MNDEIGFEEFAPWLVFFITLIGAFLRLILLGSKGLWLDETFSIWMANHSVADMLHWVVQIDQHPPLYYLLLHYWIVLNGGGPFNVRLFSVLFGTATIPVVYLIGKRMAGITAGLAASLLMTFSLFNIYYAQETRMYTLLAFNAAVAIYALVRLLTDPRALRPIGAQFRDYLRAWRTNPPVEPDHDESFSYKSELKNPSGWRAWLSRHRWSPIQTIETDLAWVAFIVFSALTLYSHNTAVLFPLATNIFVLGLLLFQRLKKHGPAPAFQAPSLGNWLKAQLAILLLWSPWLVFFIRQASAVDRRFWIPAPTWDAVLQVIGSFLNPAVGIPPGQALAIWIMYGLVFCLGLVFFRKKISHLLFLAALFAIPFLGELLVSLRRPIFYDRTLIWTTIPLYLLLAAGIAQLRFRYLIIFAVGALCTFSLFSASDYYKFYQKEDWGSAARDVAAFVEKDDLILFNSNFVEIPFDYYTESFNLNSTQVDVFLHVPQLGVPADLFKTGLLEPEMTTKDVPALLSLLHGHKRVWLVYSHNSYTDPHGLIPQTLASQMKLVQTDDFTGGQVLLYEAP